MPCLRTLLAYTGSKRPLARKLRRKSEKSEERFLSLPAPESKSLKTSQSASGGGTDGGAILLDFCGPLNPFSCSKMNLFYLKTCTPVKGTPEAPLEIPKNLKSCHFQIFELF